MKLHICKPLIESMGVFHPHLYQPISTSKRNAGSHTVHSPRLTSAGSRKRSAPAELDALESHENSYPTYKVPSKRQNTVDIRESCEMIENHRWELYKAYLETKNACATLDEALLECTKAKQDTENELTTARLEVCASLF